MTEATKLERLIERAIEGGWRGGRHLNWSGDWIGEVPTLEVMSLFPSHPFLRYTTGGVDVEEHTHPPEIMLFDKDFARALFDEASVPSGEEIDDTHSRLGLYEAEGGGYEGYGDYVYLTFKGQAWQYHLQQAVISANPIDYYYNEVFGKDSNVS